LLPDVKFVAFKTHEPTQTFHLRSILQLPLNYILSYHLRAFPRLYLFLTTYTLRYSLFETEAKLIADAAEEHAPGRAAAARVSAAGADQNYQLVHHHHRTTP
jgi:hypothetical protein